LATICQAGFFNENNAITEDKSSIQDEQDLCQRQVDQLAKALKMCYETPPAPATNGFLKRDYSRGKGIKAFSFILLRNSLGCKHSICKNGIKKYRKK